MRFFDPPGLELQQGSEHSHVTANIKNRFTANWTRCSFLHVVESMSTTGKVYVMERPAWSQKWIAKVKQVDPQLASEMENMAKIQCTVDIGKSECYGCGFWQHCGFPCACACAALAAAQAELSADERKNRPEMSPTNLPFFQKHFHR